MKWREGYSNSVHTMRVSPVGFIMVAREHGGFRVSFCNLRLKELISDHDEARRKGIELARMALQKALKELEEGEKEVK